MALRISRELIDSLKELFHENENLFLTDSEQTQADAMVMLLEIMRYLGLAKVSIESDGTVSYEPVREHAPLVVDVQGDNSGKPSMGDLMEKVNQAISGKMDMFDFETYIAENFLDQGRIEETLETIELMEKVYKHSSDSKALGRFERLKGAIHFFRGELGKAKKLFEKAESLCLDKGDTEGVGLANLGIGNILGSLNEVKEAEVAYDKAYVCFREVESTKGMAKVKGNLSYLYSRNGMIRESTTVGYEAIRMLVKLNDKNNLQNLYLNRAVMLASHGNYRDAFENTMDAYYISLETGNDRVFHLSRLQMAEIDIALRKKNVNKQNIDNSVAFFKGMNYSNDLGFAYGVLSLYYIGISEEKLAIHNMEMCIKTYDKIKDYMGMVAIGIRLMRMMVIHKTPLPLLRKVNSQIKKTLLEDQWITMYDDYVSIFYREE